MSAPKPLRFTLVLVVLLGGVWFAFGDLIAPPRVEVASVTEGTAVRAVYGTGTVEPVRTATLRAPSAGVWSSVVVDDGDRVAAEQLLGQVTAPTLVHDLAVAEVDLEASADRADSVPGVSSLRAESAAVEARLALARTDLERSRRLSERGIEASRTIEQLEAEIAQHEASLRSLRAQRRDAAQGVEYDEERNRAMVQRARALIEATMVRAPFDGVVLERLAEPTEWVPVGQPLLRVGDDSEFRVEVEIDEVDVRDVAPGQPVRVAINAFGDERFAGTVSAVSTDTNRARGTVMVEITFDDPPAELRPGLSTQVNVIVEQREAATLLPNTAIDGDRVWLVTDGRVTPFVPAWGIRGATHSELVDALPDGRVVDRPAPDLRDGQRVRVGGDTRTGSER